MGMNSPDYLTYKKSKQKLERAEKKGSKFKVVMWIFLITFSLCFAIFTNFTAKYTTKMDIEYDKSATTAQGQVYIGNAFGEDSLLSAREADEKNRVIDNRLRLIQLEETAPSEARVVNLDKNAVIDREHYESLRAGEDTFVPDEKPAVHKNEPAANVMVPVSAVSPTVAHEELAPQTFSKVLAGKYKTFEDAKAAQISIRNSGQVGTPFIRKIGEVYTLQVGSYANPDVARNVAQNYTGLGFDVWILEQ